MMQQEVEAIVREFEDEYAAAFGVKMQRRSLISSRRTRRSCRSGET